MNTQLNYHHLRYFLAVATCGGITSAAEALHVSAPTLSAQVRELEEFFGTTLFRREGRRMTPTETGRHLLGFALLCERACLKNCGGRFPRIKSISCWRTRPRHRHA